MTGGSLPLEGGLEQAKLSLDRIVVGADACRVLAGMHGAVEPANGAVKVP
jgi:hypothetical protein